MLRYRADIDGLRAVAVVPIVLFHCGLAALSGGFVGVDIFFVISGFLITGIIVREMDTDSFSILKFYKRRIVRILPALFAMLIVALAAGIFLLLPSELNGLGNSAAAASGFVSNIYFWRDSGYFAGAAETKPLLHTWSLGVEEQFYLFYPLLLMVMRRFAPRHLRAVLIVVGLLSFAVSLAACYAFPDAGFYLLPSRAWQLALGGLVALGAYPRVEDGRRRDALALLGIGLIAAAYLVIRADFAFPAPWGLLPCLGAALLIAYGETAVTGRLLTLKLMRGIGAISYSLYLWHWPIITFWRLQYGMELSAWEVPLLALASTAAAIASYFAVEQPFLRRFRDTRALPACIVGAIAVVAMVGLGMAVAANASRFHRYPPQVAKVLAYLDYNRSPENKFQYRARSCFVKRSEVLDEKLCLAVDPKRRNVVLAGDSHAAQLWRALQERSPEINFLQATPSGCRPFLGTRPLALDSVANVHCGEIAAKVFGPLIEHNRIDGMILAGRWRENELDDVVKTIRFLRARGIAVTVIGPIVEYSDDFPKLMARALLLEDLRSLDRMVKADRFALDRRMRPAVEAAGGRYVSMTDIECPGGKCIHLTKDGVPYQADYGHLTLRAAREVVAQFPAF
ncbi:acyltransferase family protein [Sphingomonas canadensis]|uniref:Acyltransferase family protein n=1 Tax=Sphingomonas canadensis TaxID=1219257 RepID=A0ABW3H5T4_9SPHN|nr:acyltransferase family protein [Sphingomonas canadensis]MCW3835099.1 acyltransferase [Sphingomonas canadensis]